MCRLDDCGPLGKIWTRLEPAGGRSGGGGGLQGRERQRDGLQRPGRRPLDTHHGIHPLADARILLEETRICDVHAAGIGDAPVDHRDLAVIAQIKTHKQGPQRVHRQNLDHLHSGRPQSGDRFGLEERAAAQRIHQRTARHPALRRPGQRGHEIVHEPTRTPDVELGMNRGRCRIDIRNQCLHARFAVGQQLQAMPGHQGHADRPAGQPADALRTRCQAVRRREAGGRNAARPFEHLGLHRNGAAHPGPAQSALADQEVHHHAHHRHQDHQQQPGQRTAIGVAPGKQPKGNRQQNGHVKKGQQAEVHCRSVVSGRSRRHHARATVSARA